VRGSRWSAHREPISRWREDAKHPGVESRVPGRSYSRTRSNRSAEEPVTLFFSQRRGLTAVPAGRTFPPSTGQCRSRSGRVC
jgi:hypothetical protein